MEHSRNVQYGLLVGVPALYWEATKWLVSFGSDASPSLLVAQAGTYLALVAIGLSLARAMRVGLWRSRSGLGKIALGSILLAAIVVMVRFAIMQPPTGWAVKSAQDWRDVIEGYLIGRLLVPVAEEIAFRGILYHAVKVSLRGSEFGAIVITAVVFAGLHWPALYGLHSDGGVQDVLSALAAGLAFGGLRAVTRSVVPGLSLHVIGNSVGF